MPAHNKRFGARRGVRPQKVLSEFESFAPARTFVKPRPVAKRPLVSVHCKDETDDRLITEFLLHKDKKGKEESSPHSGTFVFARHTKTNASQSQKSLHFSDTHRTLLISF